jgi:hypothetical protein
MARPARLQSALTWLKTYNGKNIAVGYRKHFGVDWGCAFRELEMLGVRIDPVYKGRVLRSLEGHIAVRRPRKSRLVETDEIPQTHEFPLNQDDYFAYIAGYTEGGFAYGITWEEWERLDQETLLEP